MTEGKREGGRQVHMQKESTHSRCRWGHDLGRSPKTNCGNLVTFATLNNDAANLQRYLLIVYSTYIVYLFICFLSGGTSSTRTVKDLFCNRPSSRVALNPKPIDISHIVYPGT